jgi:formate dehydrogenase
VAKVLCVLYADPTDGHPLDYVRDSIPRIELYPDGQTMPSPAANDFRPGELLGDLTGGLGLQRFLAARGHMLIATSDHDGPTSAFEQALPDADILITQACWPAMLNVERIAKAPNLRLVITAGTGSDHIDLEAAARRGITAVEITYSDSVAAAEYAVWLVLSLVHNAAPAFAASAKPQRTMANQIRRAYDLEGMHVGSIGAGRTGLAFLRRMRPFDVNLHYTDPRRLPLLIENELGLTYHPSPASMAPICDVLAIHTPLNRGTLNLVDAAMINGMKRGAYVVNTAADGICDPAAVAYALETGQLGGYATDTPRSLAASGMTPHLAGATLSAQARYAAGTREVLECWFDGVPIRSDYLILDRGRPTVIAVRSYAIDRQAPAFARGNRPKSLQP